MFLSVPPALDEQSLIERLRRRDPQAFETIVRAHGGRLLQVARRFVGDEEGRDAVQETFLNAFRAIDSFDHQSQLSTWLHRIVVNACLMRLRKRSAQVEQSLEPLLPTYIEDGHRADIGPAWPDTPEELLRRSEIRAVVRRAIERLPDSYRVVILLRDIEELSGQETADLMGLTTTAVKVRLHRARQALRELIDRELR